MAEITGVVKEIYAVLDQNATGTYKKVYCSISWNGKTPVDEIRYISNDVKGNIKFGKGVSLSPDNIELINSVNDTKLKSKNKKPKDDRVAVDFNSIFSSGIDVTKKRDKGYVTMDGFIKLHKIKKPVAGR